MLQMLFKAVKYTACLNDLVATLPVFEAYCHNIIDLSPSVFQQQHANAMAKIINKLHKLKAQQRVQNAFNAWNEPDTIQTLPLAMSLGSKV